MTTKYHISDNGMPGKCSAQSSDSCPKTQAGDSFHGTLEEATQESAKRFEAQLGAFVTTSRAEEEKTEEAEVALSEAKSKELGGEVYYHPQGKVIRINADGSVQAFKDGKELSTSATAEKLRAGYGQWRRGDATGLKLPGASAAPTGLSPEQQDELVENFDQTVRAQLDAKKEFEEIAAEHSRYDRENAVAEGRASYTDYSQGYDKRREVLGRNPEPKGYTKIEPLPEHKEAREKALAKWKDAVKRESESQTELEEAGLGHRIPDEGNTIRVNTQAQKWLLEDELKGQISDGKWENSSNNPWQDWTAAKVIVDPKNVGRNFRTDKDNYQLNAKDLLDVVGDRMVENVQNKTANPDYNEKAMGKDLADLRKIFKTRRSVVSGD